jgi:beta-mannosidase
LLQAEGLKEYILNYRRRWPSTTSAIFWMFNDSWPTVHGWPTFDYYLNRKPAFHPVRRANSDVIVVLADEGDQVGVYVVNDTRQPVNVTLHSGDFTPDGPIRENPVQTCQVAAFTSQRVQSLPHDPQRIAYALLRDEGGKMLAQDRLLLRPWKEWKLERPEIQVELVEQDGQRFARYLSAAWVWGVVLDPSGEANVGDDVFDLLPGIPYDVALPPGESPRPVSITGNHLLATTC